MDREKDILKTQKLASALYLVTNSFHDNEPLKWQIRQLGLNLLSHTQNGIYALGQIVAPIDQLITLTDIAKLHSSASLINFEIIKQELLTLRERVVARERAGFVDALPVSAPVSSPVLTGVTQPRQSLVSAGGGVPGVSQRLAGANNNSRQEAIYQLLKQRGPLSIKDIAHAVPGVSSKTVQRELAALVQGGKLKREGDRRWSRYLVLA